MRQRKFGVFHEDLVIISYGKTPGEAFLTKPEIGGLPSKESFAQENT